MPSKYQAIADELKIHIQAGKYASALMLPTEFALAEEYQVSRQTIRQALALLEREGLISKRRGSGSFILREQSAEEPLHRSIAVVTTYISDYIFPSILREAENVFSQHNCTPSLFATQNQIATERKVLQNLLSMPIDGILVEGTKTALPNPNLDLYRQLMQKGVPLVFMNGNYSQLHGATFVLDDNAGGGKMLVEYLVKKGHTKIAGIFKSDDIQGHGRYAGYTEGLQQAGLTVEDSLTFWYSTGCQGARFENAVLPHIEQWRDAGCTAVVCYNDEAAGSLIALLGRLGLHVPRDMAVVSFDNSHYSAYGPVPITTLSHGDANVGRVAAEKLLQLMDGKPVSSAYIPWTLIERVSG